MEVENLEFVSAVADKSDLNKMQATAAAVDAFIDVVTESLKKGEEVQFTGFGKFSVQDRAAREVASTRRPRKNPDQGQQGAEVQRRQRPEGCCQEISRYTLV